MPNEIITKKLEEFEKMVTFDKERANFFMSNGELFSKSWLEKALVEVFDEGWQKGFEDHSEDED